MAAYISKIIPLSKYYNIDPDIFEKKGILNIPLTADAPLFIDPQLLESSTYPIFSEDAWDNYKNFFQLLLHTIIAANKLEGALKSRAIKKATRLLLAPEQKGLCLGYSTQNNKGRGIGPARAKQILDSAIEIIKHGTIDPDLFSVIFLLEEGFGGDCISDLTAKIILPQLCEFTQAIACELKIQTQSYIIKNKHYMLPQHPIEKDCYLLFVPVDIVNKLPTETNLHGVLRTFLSNFQHTPPQSNDSLRDNINQQIADIWINSLRENQSDRAIKNILKQLIYKEPIAVNSVITAVERTDLPPINFETDLDGFNIAAKFYKYFDPSIISGINKQNKLKTIDELLKRFQKYMSDHTDYKRYLLYTDGKHKNEHAWQQTFNCYIDDSLRRLDIDITPEFPTGRGPVDFKFSEGETFKVLVEIKLSTNPQYLSGFTKQLEIYKNATNNVKKAYFIFVDLSKDKKSTDQLQKLLQLKKDYGLDTEILVIDGTLPDSASKVH